MKQFDNPVLNVVPLADGDNDITVSGNWDDWGLPEIQSVQDIKRI